MLQVVQAGNLTLHEVKQKFNLHHVTDPEFFPEWQVSAPDLNTHEQYTLDKAKADFQYLDEYPLNEEMVREFPELKHPKFNLIALGIRPRAARG